MSFTGQWQTISYSFPFKNEAMLFVCFFLFFSFASHRWNLRFQSQRNNDISAVEKCVLSRSCSMFDVKCLALAADDRLKRPCWYSCRPSKGNMKQRTINFVAIKSYGRNNKSVGFGSWWWRLINLIAAVLGRNGNRFGCRLFLSTWRFQHSDF